MALCCVTSATAPVWAQTEWADPVVKISSPNLEQHEGTQQFYIYHPATGQFLTNGNSYNTQLSVGETGQMITMEWGEERPPLYNTPVKVKGEGWKLNMLNAQSNSGFHEIYVTDATHAYVDCDDQGHTLWQILPQGDNLYRIKIVDQDTIYGKNSTNTVTMNGVWGVVEGSTVVYPFADPEAVEIYAGAEMDWQFVTPEDYDAYRARLELKPMLEEAQEIGLGDQLGEYTEIYNNQASTSEQLETVIANLPVDIIAWQAGEASEEQPANFTAVISNADFDAGNDGWSYIESAPGQQGTTYLDANGENEMTGFAEKWVNSGNGGNLGNSFDIYQTLSAMPAGKYRLSATSIAYWQADREVTPTGVYLYSVVNGLEVRTEAHTLEYGGTHVGTTEDPATVPQPRAVSMDFVNPERGDIRIGFKTVNTNCNWAGVDNFKLEYLGDTGVSSMADMVQQIVDEFNAQIQDYANNNLVYSAAGEASANALLAKVGEAMAAQVDNDSLSALGNALYTEMATLQTDVDAYTELSTFLTEGVNEYFTGAYADYANDFVELNNYLGQVDAELQGRTFDPAGIDSVEIIADSLYQVGIGTAISEMGATNVTGLGVNMDFTGNRNGWTATGATNHGYGNNTAEEFRDQGHDGFEVYQEITGLPAGSYKVTAQAYYRPAGYNEAAAIFDPADPQADVTAYLDANGARAKVHNIFELTFDSSEGMAGRFATISGSGNELDGKMVADDLAAAEAVLTAGDRTNYEVSVIGYVGEDGVLRFGITGEPTTLANSWCLFDNFRIEYLPGDPTGMTNLLETKIDQANEIVGGGSGMYITDESGAALATASANASAALAGELTQEIAEEHNAALDAALALATETDAAIQAMVSAYNSYDAILVAIEDGDDLTAYDQDAVADLEDAVADQTDYVDGYETYADIAAVNQALADMNNAYGAMVKSALNFTTASKEEPVDVSALIRNPRLQKTVNGVETPTVEYWEFNPEPTNYKAITVDHRLDSLIEFFNFTEFDFHQTLYNMPQGYYTLSVSSFYRYGDMTPAGVARRDGYEELLAQVYATTDEADYYTPIVSIYEHVMDAKFTSSSAVLPDSLFTYMQPQTYYCVANAVDDANVAFNYGFYRNDVSFYVAEGGTVQVGIRKADGVTNDWCPFDDFALVYLGDGEENNPGVVGVEDVIGENAATVVATEWYTIDGMRVAEPKKGGIYVRVNKMDDGSQKATKVLIK